MSNSVTPLAIIADVSRIITVATDRITGDRTDYPLLVAGLVVNALKQYSIQSRILYGNAAWIEILNNQQAIWAGCWGEFFSFWVESEFGEVIDLNVSVSHRKKSHQSPELQTTYSPPLLWSNELPSFYRYAPTGIAEIELTEPTDVKRFEALNLEVQEKCQPQLLGADELKLSFPNEPILCSGRRLLDDSRSSFKHFDRALSVYGIPAPPF